jgi:hypothetical protein
LIPLPCSQSVYSEDNENEIYKNEEESTDGGERREGRERRKGGGGRDRRGVRNDGENGVNDGYESEEEDEEEGEDGEEGDEEEERKENKEYRRLREEANKRRERQNEVEQGSVRNRENEYHKKGEKGRESDSDEFDEERGRDDDVTSEPRYIYPDPELAYCQIPDNPHDHLNGSKKILNFYRDIPWNIHSTRLLFEVHFMFLKMFYSIIAFTDNFLLLQLISFLIFLFSCSFSSSISLYFSCISSLISSRNTPIIFLTFL